VRYLTGRKVNKGTRFEYLAKIVFVFAIYFVTARLGLKIGAVNKFATLVWPPTGISLVAVLIFGFRIWPAIALGAFFANTTLGAPIFAALGMSLGNTLEAVIGAYLLQRMAFKPSIERLWDVFSLVVSAAFVSTLLSATFGVTSLFLTGVLPTGAIAPTWTAWWLGDVMGDLLIAPFFLVWISSFEIRKTSLRHAIELMILGLLVVGGSFLLCTDFLLPGSAPFPHPYLVFPLLMLVAVRLDQKWTITALLTVAIITIWAATVGHGRFLASSLSDRLLQTQIFLGVLTISKMVLAASTMEGKRLYREAQNAIFERDEFLSIASHELRTPLTALTFQLQIFNHTINKLIEKRKQGSEDIETVPVPLKSAMLVLKSEEQSKKLSGLLDDLLDLTRIRLGQLQLRKEEVDLCRAACDVRDLFKTKAAAAGVHISVQCEPGVTGHWDRIRIEQVINNLISNALKYGEGKPISVLVERMSGRQRVKLVVQDQGKGIDPKMLEKVFERFERAGMTDQKISGSGLGLYICRQIVEAHGGQIRVTSEVGIGSAFIVELPTN
jgi:signal transduction histidine kinase